MRIVWTAVGVHCGVRVRVARRCRRALPRRTTASGSSAPSTAQAGRRTDRCPSVCRSGSGSSCSPTARTVRHPCPTTCTCQQTSGSSWAGAAAQRRRHEQLPAGLHRRLELSPVSPDLRLLRDVPPVPAEFMVAARIVATNHKDTRRIDDTGRTMIVAVRAQSDAGGASTRFGAPVAGSTFRWRAGRRAGVRLTPVDARSPRDRFAPRAPRHGNTRPRPCWLPWLIPRGSAGTTLRTTVTVTAGSLRAQTSWGYAIRASR